jgi:uncharacterized protein involved in response to NO
VGFGIALLVLGGFLLGGAYSVWTGFGDPGSRERTSGQVAAAGVLLVAALMASVAGVLRLV